jgi:hypothetical protein
MIALAVLAPNRIRKTRSASADRDGSESLVDAQAKRADADR